MAYSASWITLKKERELFLTEEYISYTAPSAITAPASLEFKGIVSDFLFLKVSTFLGGEIGEKKELTENHAKYVYDTSSIITDLDPYFWDAYLFSFLNLSWGFRKYETGNR